MKKWICLFLVLATLLSCTVFASAAVTHDSSYKPTELVAGDVNLDGKINAADALIVLYASVAKYAQYGTPAYYAQRAGDVNNNNKIQADDALLILKKAVGKVDSFERKTLELPPEAENWIWGWPPEGYQQYINGELNPIQYWCPAGMPH